MVIDQVGVVIDCVGVVIDQVGVVIDQWVCPTIYVYVPTHHRQPYLVVCVTLPLLVRMMGTGL